MDRFVLGDVSVRNSLRSNDFTSTIVLSLAHRVLVVLREPIYSKSCFGWDLELLMKRAEKNCCTPTVGWLSGYTKVLLVVERMVRTYSTRYFIRTGVYCMLFWSVCCLHIKPFFLLNISTPSVHADSSSYRDTKSVVTDGHRVKAKQAQLIKVRQVKF